MVLMFLVPFSNDGLPERLSQPNPFSLRRTFASRFYLSARHPTAQEVVELLVVAVGTRVLARGLLPTAVVVMGCCARFPLAAVWLTSLCKLANFEGSHSAPVAEQAFGQTGLIASDLTRLCRTGEYQRSEAAELEA